MTPYAKRPADAGRDPARDPRRPDLLPRGAPAPVPGRRARRQLPAQLPAPVARRARARLRRPDHAAELKATKQAGYKPQDVIGQAGIEQSYDRYLRGRTASTQLTVDSRGRPTSPIKPTVAPAAGQHAAAHDRHRPPARRRAGAARRHRARARRRRDLRPTAARSSRSTRATAPCSRWRRTRPTSRRSTSAATREARAAPERRRSPREKNYPGPEPRDRRHLSAGLDVEAGDGARGDAGAHPLAVLERFRARRASRSTSRPSTTGTPTSTSRWSCRRRSPSRATPTSTRSAQRSTSCRRAAATTLQLWASRFGFGAPTGIDIGPEDAGLVPTPEWRVPALRRPAVTARSTGSGSRATRSSSRSARATSR